MLSEEHYVILEAYKRYSGRNAIAYRLNAAETSQNISLFSIKTIKDINFYIICILACFRSV